MRKGVLVCMMMFSSSLVFGQLDSNSITVNASRSTNLQPDQAVFAVTVQSGLSTSLDDVIAALQGSGITTSNFSSVRSLDSFTIIPPVSQPTSGLAWDFTLAAPLSKTKDTVASLASLQQSLAQGKSGLKLSFGVQGTRVSAQLLQSQTCSLADLVSDARAQAQKMADAAGLTLGSILALSSATSSSGGVVIAALTGLLTDAYAPPCALTVKFAVTRFQ
jgi:uncharacterized protein YggE